MCLTNPILMNFQIDVYKHRYSCKKTDPVEPVFGT